jgi:hypothetical protein
VRRGSSRAGASLSSTMLWPFVAEYEPVHIFARGNAAMMLAASVRRGR